MMTKTVLCFGDSNTWGRSPFGLERLPPESRWPVVMQQQLGDGYQVIIEGLNARTTVWEDPIEEGRCGKTYLLPCLMSHDPIDLVILMLGTNDLKKRFSVSAFDIGRSIGLLLDKILASKTGPGGTAPQVLLMCPPPVAKLTAFADMFEGAPEKSRQLAPHYQQHAELRGCRFFDTGTLIRSSDADGIHFEPQEHKKLGERVAQLVREAFPTA